MTDHIFFSRLEEPTLSKLELFMLGVAIVLPSVDNYTDVNFGVRLLTGFYDQGWDCKRKIDPGRAALGYEVGEDFIKFADTDPSNNGKLIRDFCKKILHNRPVRLLSHTHM